jgi:tRNA pseudouridine55 synthase
MPKVALGSLPISGLFAVAKPSGPTSMAVVETIKQLVCQSRLFVEESKLAGKGGKKRKHKHRDMIKIGQGGTLDPLADGVLGVYGVFTRLASTLTSEGASHWYRQGY